METMKVHVHIEPEAPPLQQVDGGAICVRGSRVTLETIYAAFRQGNTAEQISQMFPTIALGDIYAVIAFVLRHPAEVAEYVHERERIGDVVRREMETHFDPQGIRDRLLARHERKS